MGILKNKIIRQFHSNVFRGEIIKSAGILSSQKIPSNASIWLILVVCLYRMCFISCGIPFKL